MTMKTQTSLLLAVVLLCSFCQQLVQSAQPPVCSTAEGESPSACRSPQSLPSDDVDSEFAALGIDEDLEWYELTEDQRRFLESRRWTERHWNCDAEAESLLKWRELSPERQLIWKKRRWNKERWNEHNDDPCNMRLDQATPEDFKPIVVDMKVPAIDQLDVEALKKLDIEIRLVDGYASKELVSEGFAAKKPIRDFITDVENGDTQFYIHLEESMYEKRWLTEAIGKTVINSLLEAIKKHDVLLENGLWKSEWDDLDEKSFDWAMFVGANGTNTHMHYDTDVFNFLYVVSGRKRFVLVPNDERTKGKFNTVSNTDSGTGWGQADLLDRTKPLPEYAVELEIGPGQGIAVPYLSWHAVENLEASLAYPLRILD